MATTLYTNDNQGNLITVSIETKRVQAYLANGYVCDPSELGKKSEVEKADYADKVIKIANDSASDIREAAKDAGIRNWHNKKLATLKSELGYDED